MGIDFLLDEVSIDTFNDIKKWKGKLSPFVSQFVQKTDKKEPEWYISSIKLANFPVGFIKGSDSNASAGTSIDKEEAIIKSIGEALERYCLSNYFTLDQIFSKYIDESKGYARCADFENAPKTFKKEGISEEIEHTEVKRLLDDKIDYLPFEYVHLGFMRSLAIGMHTSGISSGCAFYPDKDVCIWKSICEVVERHVFMEFWHLNFKGAKRILPENIASYSFNERYKRIRKKGLNLNMFEISDRFGIPVVFTIVSGDFFPYYACGISCNDNIYDAINKSMDEAISLRSMAVWNGYRKETDTTSFEWINRLEDHMELYANWKNAPIMEKLISSDCDIYNFNDSYSIYYNLSTSEKLKQVAINFKDIGYDIYYKDITMPEVKKSGYVFKVVIPQMLPLSQSYRVRWLDYFIKKGIKKESINKFPQPFS